MLIRTLIDRVDRSRRLARRVLKDANARRYTSAMDDLFSVPLGYVGPDQGPDNELSPPAIPAEAFEHRGKWVAFRGAGLDMIRDTQEELLEALGDQRLGVVLFHVPETRNFAR